MPLCSALITIDTQNDFTLEGAPARIPGTAEVVPAMRVALEAFRAAGRPIVHVVRLYKADGSNVDACRRALVEDGAVIVCPGAQGAELVDALKPDPATRLDPERLLAGDMQQIGPNEWLVYKPRWSAFHATRLDETLRKWRVNTIVISGCNYPNCPRATIYDASNRDYRIMLVLDAMSGLYEKGLQELAGIGVSTVPSARVADWLLGAS
jgi:nicotinamidase-related amidase